MIKLDLLKCLRFDYKGYECQICLDVCPFDSIEIDFNNKLRLNLDKCTNCAGCVGSCPSEAISYSEFDENRFANTKALYLSCKSNTPCLAIFDTKHYIKLSSENSLTIDLSHCNECNLKFKQLIESKIFEADKITQNIKIDKVDIKPKREIFNKIISNLSQKDKIEFEDGYPKKNQLLKELNFEIFNAKKIDTSCTNCFDCTDFCPTKALTKSDKDIIFEPIKCIDCSICEMVCRQKSISKLNKSANRDKITLISHNMKICKECNMPFSSSGADICNVCQNRPEEFENIFKTALEIEKSDDS